jgi:6-phosphogluconolactonase (cycloisomerase 2 family)
MSIFAPDSDDCIMVPDLGGDCIHQLKINGTKMSIDNSIKVKHPGCGPRHLAIDP